MTLIKICGITNIEDAVESVRLGANLIGFVFAESPRKVDIETVKNINRIIGGDVKTVGVFTEESEEILRIMDLCELDFAQLHGSQSEKFADKIGALRVIRVVRVKDENSIKLLSQYEKCQYYLLDTYKKGVPGGTGETFNWELARLAKKLEKPFFLSGGLSPENISDAIQSVHPFGVDVSSGVEQSPGKKDIAKVKEFIENVRKNNSSS